MYKPPLISFSEGLEVVLFDDSRLPKYYWPWEVTSWGRCYRSSCKLQLVVPWKLKVLCSTVFDKADAAWCRTLSYSLSILAPGAHGSLVSFKSGLQSHTCILNILVRGLDCLKKWPHGYSSGSGYPVLIDDGARTWCGLLLFATVANKKNKRNNLLYLCNPKRMFTFTLNFKTKRHGTVLQTNIFNRKQ